MADLRVKLSQADDPDAQGRDEAFRPCLTALLAPFTTFRAVRASAGVLLRRAGVATFFVLHATAFAFLIIAAARVPGCR
jgi:hypothetical protein